MSRHRRQAARFAGAVGLFLLASSVSASAAAENPQRPPEDNLPTASELDYVADIDVRHANDGANTTPRHANGRVFHDLNKDGVRQRDEPGIAGITVSNGREVVRTDRNGRYRLPAYQDMSVFVSTPNDWRAPTDENNVPQFSYEHKPQGSPRGLRFGGLEPTGPLPRAINFPLQPVQVTDEFDCLLFGDTQPYSNNEAGHLRDGVLHDVLQRADPGDYACMLLSGDVVGDDLDLLPRVHRMLGTVGAPQYHVRGNHDMDYDVTDNADSADTWRREYGPRYYSFDIGRVHFVMLDNVVYPCTEQDLPPECGDPEDPIYNGRITDEQLEWLRNDLARVPRESLVVLNSHIPMVSFAGSDTDVSQTDNANQLYRLLADRPALSIAAHTHTLEQFLPGESYAGWKENVGVESVPFHHLLAGAPSGSWYSGDLGIDGVPMALGRLGEPRGYLTLEFDGNSYVDSFHASGQPASRQMWLSFDTPAYRAWFEKLRGWTATNPPVSEQTPPVNVNDLPDNEMFTTHDLSQGVHLTANVWYGTRDSEVSVRIDGGEPIDLERTQQGAGEPVRVGVSYSDPFSVQRQLQIARTAFVSESGNERAQGYERGRGLVRGPGAPQADSETFIAEKSSHIWRAQLPTDLSAGTHVAEVTHLDRHGRSSTERMIFEVVEEMPPAFWRHGPWQDVTGPGTVFSDDLAEELERRRANR